MGCKRLLIIMRGVVMRFLLNGATRTVILTNRYAIKIPCILHKYKMFICGILANISEGGFVNFHPNAKLAKTFYSNRFGLLNVQERVRPVRNRGLFAIELCALCANGFLPKNFYMDDAKPENFGYN